MNLVSTNISHAQRAKIYALAKDLNIDNDTLHTYMLEWCSCISLKDNVCTGRQADIIISCLEKIKMPKFPGRKNKYSLTEAQWNRLMSEMSRLGWNEARMLGFAKHTCGISILDDIADLTVMDATKTITGLKYMKEENNAIQQT